MKTLNKSSFDNNYQYNDYKKEVKKADKQRREARQMKRTWE